jgi:hypothetical protein
MLFIKENERLKRIFLLIVMCVVVYVTCSLILINRSEVRFSVSFSIVFLCTVSYYESIIRTRSNSRSGTGDLAS